MFRSDDKSKIVVPRLYEKTYLGIDQLRTSLPETALETLAREVINRLAQKARDIAPRKQEITDLAKALIGPDTARPAQLIDHHYSAGADVKSLHLDYLAPAAELLGEWWMADEIKFSDVTIGTGRIYAVMRNLSRQFPLTRVLETKRALFAAVPGEDHTLGVRMATELARKQGWDVELVMSSTDDELVDRIVQSDQLIIGLSGGGIRALPELARTVLAIQIGQPAAMLLVSGNFVNEARDALELMNVDAIESDFDGALAALEHFWDTLSARLE